MIHIRNSKTMKFIQAILAAGLISASSFTGVSAQTQAKVQYRFTEASDLNLIGKIHDDTTVPYHRVDTCVYKGFTEGENIQVRCPAGLAVLFKTDSPVISVLPDYGYMNKGSNTMGIALRGYDLYIKKDGEWLYAASKAPAEGREENNLVLIRDLPEGEKECMLYLPIYSELYSLKIGTAQDSEISPLESPFRHRVGIFGSSFTQGISISRPGMSYPMQFMRNTGIQILGLGCSGNCKMQPYFADVLADADVDALIFDSFSNPDAAMIEERLFPFIERIREAHPDIPLIFMQTIYREGRNFCTSAEAKEKAKVEMAEKLMKEAVGKYHDVYFIHPDTGPDGHETSVDGTHPSDMGYKGWAESIEKPVLKILRKYGIR